MSHASEGHKGSAHDCGKCDEDFSREARLANSHRDPGDPGPGCFPASAMIAVPSGEISMGEIRVGQMALSRNSRGALVPRCVTRKLSHPPQELITVRFTDGGKDLLSTGSQSFSTGRGWLRLAQLHRHDVIYRGAGEGRTITCIVPTGRRVPVYNLHTEGEHTYIADGCVTHNFSYMRSLRTWFHRLFLDGRRGHSSQAVSVGD